jgi:importin subunit alpha-6/7
LQSFPQLLHAIWGDSIGDQADATSKLRILLSLERDPPIQLVVQSPGLVQRLVQFLGCVSNPQLQLEAAWCLTNIASGSSEETAAIVKEGAISNFIALLDTTTFDEIKEQVIWGLGNIAGNNVEFRDLVLHAGALGPLCRQINDSSKLTTLRNAAWALSNLCRGKPIPPLPVTREILTWLCKLVYHDQDEEIMTESMWAFSYLTDAGEEVVDEVLRCGVARRIADSLMHPSVVRAFTVLFWYLER